MPDLFRPASRTVDRHRLKQRWAVSPKVVDEHLSFALYSLDDRSSRGGDPASIIHEFDPFQP